MSERRSKKRPNRFQRAKRWGTECLMLLMFMLLLMLMLVLGLMLMFMLMLMLLLLFLQDWVEAAAEAPAPASGAPSRGQNGWSSKKSKALISHDLFLFAELRLWPGWKRGRKTLPSTCVPVNCVLCTCVLMCLCTCVHVWSCQLSSPREAWAPAVYMCDWRPVS